MVRSVADGLASVDDDVRLASVAMGYGPFRRFWAVDFPLAGPVILAGLRVMAASTIGLATVGILVGVTNLGYLFTNGLQRRILVEVFSGIVAVVVIAVVVDILLVLAGRLLLPWARRPRRRRAEALAVKEALA
jgi:osmoprotectant transport system permease protein